MTSGLQFEWIEHWVAPGICLLAKSSAKTKNMFGRVTGRLAETGIWCLVDEDEALLFNMPFADADSLELMIEIEDFAARHELQINFASCANIQYENSAGLFSALRRFSSATFVYPFSWKNQRRPFKILSNSQPKLKSLWNREPNLPYRECWPQQLGNEKIFLLESVDGQTVNQIVIFRGVAIIPSNSNQMLCELESPECLGEELKQIVLQIANFEIEYNYDVHSRVSISHDRVIQDLERLSHSMSAEPAFEQSRSA